MVDAAADRVILLVEDSPKDEELTLRALKSNVLNPVVVAHDGAEALDYYWLLLNRNAPAPRER